MSARENTIISHQRESVLEFYGIPAAVLDAEYLDGQLENEATFKGKRVVLVQIFSRDPHQIENLQKIAMAAKDRDLPLVVTTSEIIENDNPVLQIEGVTIINTLQLAESIPTIKELLSSQS